MYSVVWLLRYIIAFKGTKPCSVDMEAYETLAKTIEDDLKLGQYAYTKTLEESLEKERKRARPWISAFNWLVVMLWVSITIYSGVTLLKPIL